MLESANVYDEGERYVLRFAHESLQKYRDVMLESVKQQGRNLEYLNESLKNINR